MTVVWGDRATSSARLHAARVAELAALRRFKLFEAFSGPA
jgi:hypothetical protein